MTNLAGWGWDDAWTVVAEPLSGARFGRITGQHRDRWDVQLETGPVHGRLIGASFAGARPVTGDWVAVPPGPNPADPVSIAGVLPRRSSLSRGEAGTGAAEHVLAANVDVVWIVHGLDMDPNPRRLERYLAVAWESGAVPELVLTKADLAAAGGVDVAAELGSIAPGVDVHIVSTEWPESVRALRAQLKPGRTVALVGPSGAGKSSLINALADLPLAATGAVRDVDRKGRHTTTRRELFQIPGGALLLDTPGLRELRVWALEMGLGQAFPEIGALAVACRFRDCRHETEPGCAVLAAVAAGDLDEDRLASFRKLGAEAAYMERRSDPEAQAAAVAKHKTALKTLKYHPKYRRED
jgi:ribosome biogenesis GTPase / thiamine phosphate phosphatase